jgi:hypothetical protein
MMTGETALVSSPGWETLITNFYGREADGTCAWFSILWLSKKFILTQPPAGENQQAIHNLSKPSSSFMILSKPARNPLSNGLQGPSSHVHDNFMTNL